MEDHIKNANTLDSLVEKRIELETSLEKNLPKIKELENKIKLANVYFLFSKELLKEGEDKDEDYAMLYYRDSFSELKETMEILKIDSPKKEIPKRYYSVESFNKGSKDNLDNIEALADGLSSIYSSKQLEEFSLDGLADFSELFKNSFELYANLSQTLDSDEKICHDKKMFETASRFYLSHLMYVTDYMSKLDLMIKELKNENRIMDIAKLPVFREYSKELKEPISHLKGFASEGYVDRFQIDSLVNQMMIFDSNISSSILEIDLENDRDITTNITHFGFNELRSYNDSTEDIVSMILEINKDSEKVNYTSNGQHLSIFSAINEYIPKKMYSLANKIEGFSEILLRCDESQIEPCKEIVEHLVNKYKQFIDSAIMINPEYEKSIPEELTNKLNKVHKILNQDSADLLLKRMNCSPKPNSVDSIRNYVRLVAKKANSN